jgi:hypothetical protein
MNITLDEIRSKAPEGATHWLIAVTKNPVYFDVNNELIFTKKGWCTFHIDDCFMKKLKPL